MASLALNFALAHKDYVIGAVVGYSFAHVRLAVDYVFDLLDKFPAFHAFVVKNAADEKAAIDAAADEAKKKIDSAVAKDAPKP